MKKLFFSSMMLINVCQTHASYQEDHDLSTFGGPSLAPQAYTFNEHRVDESIIQILSIKTLIGRTITVHINSESTVLNLKSDLLNKDPFFESIDNINLIFAGKNLEDDKKISDYNFTKESTVHLVRRLNQSQHHHQALGSQYTSDYKEYVLGRQAEAQTQIQEGDIFNQMSAIDKAIANYKLLPEHRVTALEALQEWAEIDADILSNDLSIAHLMRSHSEKHKPVLESLMYGEDVDLEACKAAIVSSVLTNFFQMRFIETSGDNDSPFSWDTQIAIQNTFYDEEETNLLSRYKNWHEHNPSIIEE